MHELRESVAWVTEGTPFCLAISWSFTAPVSPALQTAAAVWPCPALEKAKMLLANEPANSSSLSGELNFW